MTTAHVARRTRPLPRLRLARPPLGFWLAAGWVALATLAQLTRQPGVPSWDSIWQEDGGVFYSNALNEPFLSTLFASYNSYLHVGPRIVAEVASWFPMRRAALLLSGGEALVVSLLSVYVYRASGAVLRTRWARAAVAASLILLPAAAYETGAVLSDMHWYLTYAAFWALVASPRTRAGVALAALVVAVAVLSDPQTGLLLPVALTMAWRDRRSAAAWVVPVVLVGALALQSGYGFLAHPPFRFAPSHWGDVPGIYGLRVTGSLFVGDEFLKRLFLRSWGWFFVYGSIAALLAIAAYTLRRGERAWRLFVVTAIGYSVVFLTVSVMERGTAGYLTRSAREFSLNGSRYTVLPILLLVAVVAGAVERTRLRRLQWAAAAWAAFVVLASWSITTTRSAGPSWRESLGVARLKCAGKLPQITPKLQAPAHPRAGDRIGIWVAPNVQPPLWNVQATCKRILR